VPDRSDERERADPLRARHDAQLVLAQVHGLVHLAVADVDSWLEAPQTEVDEVMVTPDDVRRAYTDVARHFGTVQAALNTGEYDDALRSGGLDGPEMTAKKKGFWGALRDFLRIGVEGRQRYLARLAPAVRWSSMLVGSIGAALGGEVKRIPGAAAAAEGVKEFLELISNLADQARTREATATRPPVDNR